MKLIGNKWFLVVVISFFALIISYYLFFENSQMTKSIGMGGMIVEEKHHYIEPGQYFEMWIIGYNAHEKKENRERYKIFIKESMVYNLIEEGEEYMVSFKSFREDEEFGYVYKLEQISNQEEYQLRGKGRIK
ncbi:hypothetical protein DS745_03415 [Anaerobacillus alkaliphilus]|uniref:Uncharacterized protein n=1 Tax=Anaerobacillus alkaliphilus TaxID=1548597 RepID=A0A4Q0VXI0_9BACI|nr:hypothetical protein [Anaerobacillus alkaliphilus]RXJ04447.1 hypothetical protein DS745_03415 [Anaerobacillus alkaliphilus]